MEMVSIVPVSISSKVVSQINDLLTFQGNYNIIVCCQNISPSANVGTLFLTTTVLRRKTGDITYVTTVGTLLSKTMYFS